MVPTITSFVEMLGIIPLNLSPKCIFLFLFASILAGFLIEAKLVHLSHAFIQDPRLKSSAAAPGTSPSSISTAAPMPRIQTYSTTPIRAAPSPASPAAPGGQYSTRKNILNIYLQFFSWVLDLSRSAISHGEDVVSRTLQCQSPFCTKLLSWN
jgi:hypothetical protein